MPVARRLGLPGRGTALGVVPDPELHASEGRLGAGEALMFYTDGVIEKADALLNLTMAGIAVPAWLQDSTDTIYVCSYTAEADARSSGGECLVGQYQVATDGRHRVVLPGLGPATEPCPGA